MHATDRLAQHPRAPVQTDDPPPGANDPGGQIRNQSCPAGHVEHGHAGRQSALQQDSAPIGPIGAEAHEPRDAIVVGRRGVEQLVDETGSLVVPLVEAAQGGVRRQGSLDLR
jgi:hypothetical protein